MGRGKSTLRRVSELSASTIFTDPPANGKPVLSRIGYAVHFAGNSGFARLRPSSGGEGPSACFSTVISRSTVVGEAQDRGTTLFETDPSHKITQQFRELAREVEERLGGTSTVNEIMKAVGEV